MVKRFERLISSDVTKDYKTPMDRDIKITKIDYEEMTERQAQFASRFPYQNVIGALLYLAINTRPDISYSVGVLARHCISPSFKACQAVVRVLMYIRSTAHIGIEYYDRDLDLHAYSDADWAGDLDSRRSTTGYVVFAAGGPIAWQ